MREQRTAEAAPARFPGARIGGHTYGTDDAVSPVGRRASITAVAVLPREADVGTLHRDLDAALRRLDLVELDAAGQTVDLLLEVGDRAGAVLGDVGAAEAR